MDKTKPNISILSVNLGSGGAQKVISLLLQELKNNYNVSLVLFYNHIHFNVPNDINVVYLSKASTERGYYSKLRNLIIFNKKYNAFIKEENINISVSFLAFPNIINGMMATKNKNIKTIISERGLPEGNTTSNLSLKIAKVFYPIFYNKCSKLFSNSVYINQTLKENFKINIPMEVIYNPVVPPINTLNPNNLITDIDCFKIITTGTLNKRKNQIMIIRALRENIKNYRLTILGDGPLKGYLTHVIHSLQLEKQVVLEGKVKNVNDYLLDNHCFVLSSFAEGFPNALLEAMAIGLPCISTNCISGPLELLNENKAVKIEEGTYFKGKYGLLVNNDDQIGLKKALEFLKGNPSERKNYSELSLQRSKEYQLKNIYSKFYQFINN
ncbi:MULTISPECIES: glycosyltransferase [Mangrovimonas]|uniref:glycosyltransferase n=1 Tax=Mangrovimonas TaxID=1211036 RepID=UPI0006B496D5|nr:MULTISPECIES: glycosyltransferase [Mangrovimonas]OMP30687.1 hypothetical protein BKM32_10645 [Mangrovimonas sp. DI 80]